MSSPSSASSSTSSEPLSDPEWTPAQITHHVQRVPAAPAQWNWSSINLICANRNRAII